MKIMILCGHGNDINHYDPGAIGCGFVEAKETIIYGNKIAEFLRKYATVDVFEDNMYHLLFGRSGSFDFTPYDYVLECHLNSAENVSAHGTEIYVTTSEKEITVECAIMRRLSKYFTLRDNDAVFDGVKRYNWGVIHAIKTQDQVSSALLELCFISNQSDMNIYQNKLNAICKDIAEGIAEGFQLRQSEDIIELPKQPVIAKPVHGETGNYKKTDAEIAQEVINGIWGNGQVRIEKLRNAGYDPHVIQRLVNAHYGVSSVSHKKTIDQLAQEVIHGDWGNGMERKMNLEKAGYNYKVIQVRVNQLLS
ncbi:MAG: hypothetical protein HFF01_03215 [Erysipelotrichaceae bacterium]|nr:hypothetical protein [Erysipelotrichaceae bacterium]